MWLFGETMPHVPVARSARAQVVREQPPTGRRTGKPVWYAPVAVIGDVTCAAVPVYLAFALVGGTHAVAYAMVAGAAWLLVRGARDRYGERRLGERDNIGPAVQDWLVLIGLLAVVRAVTGEESPFLLALTALVPCAPTSAAVRNLIHRHLVARRRDGRAVRRALVIGEANAVDGLVSHLAKRTDHEFVVVGVCPIGDEDPHTLAPVATRIGSTGTAAPVGRLRPGTGCGPAAPRGRGPGRAGTVPERNTPAEAVVGPARRGVPARGRTGSDRGRRAPGGRPLRGRAHHAGRGPAPEAGVATLLKSVTDRLGAALLIVLLAPVFVAVALAVRMDSPGPAVHRQTRIGRDGKPFTMAKFRTMVVDAERLRHQLTGTNEQDGRMFKIRRDPRITRVGRVLRRSSLDELPQLFNVVRGHMSLVGPRPPLPDEAAGYDEVERRRLAVKPGLTGLWQVSGRSDLSWDETVALDLRYVDNWSPSGDLEVLCRTVGAVVAGRGAY